MDKEFCLIWAARRGHLGLVKVLLELGADIHIEDEIALRWAAANGHTEVVKLLVESGANIQANSVLTLLRIYVGKWGEAVDYLKEQVDKC